MTPKEDLRALRIRERIEPALSNWMEIRLFKEELMSELIGGPITKEVGYSIAFENGKLVLKVELDSDLVIAKLKEISPNWVDVLLDLVRVALSKQG